MSKAVATGLSICGGGIKGIIPATELMDLERITKKRCRDIFNVIAGTSSGGLIASGLEKLKASDIVSLFKDNHRAIFKQKGNGVTREKFRASAIHDFLRKIYGNDRMSDIKHYDIIIPYYNLSSARPEFYTNESDISILDAMMSTTAAPSYFKPYQTEASLNADGGLTCNDPILHVIDKLVGTYPDANSYYILSLGTGVVGKTYSPKNVVDWLTLVKDACIDGNEYMAMYYAKQFSKLSTKDVVIKYINPTIPKELDTIYDPSAVVPLYSIGRSQVDAVTTIAEEMKSFIEPPKTRSCNLIERIRIDDITIKCQP